MSYNTTISRPKKAFLRDEFFSRCPSNIRTYYGLPGRECGCVKTGMKHRVITRQTKIVGVERDIKNISVIRARLAALHLKNSILCSSFGKYKKTKLQAQDFDEKYKGSDYTHDGRKVDVAFFDLCGNISVDFLKGMEWILFKPNAQLAFTFSLKVRNGSFYPALLSKPKNYKKPARFTITSGIHDVEEQHIDGAYAICNEISSSLDTIGHNIKFHMTATYCDSLTTMLFLGGYLGNTVPPKRKRT